MPTWRRLPRALLRLAQSCCLLFSWACDIYRRGSLCPLVLCPYYLLSCTATTRSFSKTSFLAQGKQGKSEVFGYLPPHHVSNAEKELYGHAAVCVRCLLRLSRCGRFRCYRCVFGPQVCVLLTIDGHPDRYWQRICWAPSMLSYVWHVTLARSSSTA